MQYKDSDIPAIYSVFFDRGLSLNVNGIIYIVLCLRDDLNDQWNTWITILGIPNQGECRSLWQSVQFKEIDIDMVSIFQGRRDNRNTEALSDHIEYSQCINCAQCNFGNKLMVRKNTHDKIIVRMAIVLGK